MSAGKGKAAAGKGKAKAATGISAVHVIISVQCVNFSRQAVFLGVVLWSVWHGLGCRDNPSAHCYSLPLMSFLQRQVALC